MANIVESYLNSNGPCLTSEVSDYLVKVHHVAPAAARKRVSRITEGSSAAVKKLAGITFPRKARFIYLQKDFGSPRYWAALEHALLSSKSVLGLGLAALRERGGIMPADHFKIACGSPLKQARHLSVDTVFDRLKSANLIELISVGGLGDCVARVQSENHYDTLVSEIRARLITEAVLLTALRDWLRKLGMASYDRVETREGGELPKVGTFAWDLSAPSYLAPMLKYSKDGAGKNGFIACDVLLGRRIDAGGILPFIHKCATLRRLRKVGTCLQIFVADAYNREAFMLAKRAGIIPATPATLFGREVAEGLSQLTEVLRKAATSVIDADEFGSLFKKFARIEGASNQLRGTLFEFLVADVARKSMGPSFVRMNRKFKTDQGDAEADVVVIHDNVSVLMIECKGYSPYARIPDDLFKHWLQKNVPRCYKAARSHPDWQNLQLRFEFWATGSLSAESLALFEQAKATINPSRHTIDLRRSDEVLAQCKLTNDPSVVEAFEKHYMKAEPLPDAEDDF
ncbi:nuclease-related domain-containing protein [Rhizobium leguminosarum]|uniref:nuclease-related domain-containing protein n=1 Tax=Rhizobium leguminosarum TaxID=384 RepID=UPI0013B741C4|nr:nuclease-related domain-containing protein [Rhizobium leguminosarum]NEI67412.1 hypothetical protein [Rhizobium leguminosarum]